MEEQPKRRRKKAVTDQGDFKIVMNHMQHNEPKAQIDI